MTLRPPRAARRLAACPPFAFGSVAFGLVDFGSVACRFGARRLAALRLAARRLAAVALLLAAAPVLADPPEVVAAGATRTGDTWRFDVTIRHPDTGWDHYADGWEVLAPDGTRLGYRELLHPHVEEQPFTRSLGGVLIPDGVEEVHIRARDSVDGWNSGTTPLTLPPAG